MKTKFYILSMNNIANESLDDFLAYIIGPTLSVKRFESYTLYMHYNDDESYIVDNLKSFQYDSIEKIKCFISGGFLNDDDLFENAQMISKYLSNINDGIYNIHQLANEYISFNITDLKASILKEYIFDNQMLDTIKVFIESNLNVVRASKALYIHRNTLMQRLDRFYLKTGFDVKEFKDAYIIYTLIK